MRWFVFMTGALRDPPMDFSWKRTCISKLMSALGTTQLCGHLGPRQGFLSPLCCHDFNDCLLDGRSDDTISAFISPRPRQDMLKFMVDAFRFAGDTSNLIYITCHLNVTSADQAPDPLNKACSFNKAGNVLQWKASETSAASVRLGTVDNLH
ncbi:zona pellucida sperm-binding protein 3-like [Mauremys reevesii]|uniref:zona pellucida sperm-binding protein 3-like n=1 Tax=Mauremys reevesii TaxID=260615 RepID=UPI0019400FB1|nr:zona pellucida sperm-binding protein 3-like [Mauremys reevesii]